MTDARAIAASALADVAVHGMSLRDALVRALPGIRDARDRAFVTALTNEGARWWLRFDAAASGLLERPLQAKDAAVRALLVLGLVQIEILKQPAYAAVAATVEAARALGKPRYAGLVNAVLRRWQRERVTRLAALDVNAVTRDALPAWLDEAIRRDWPGDAASIIAAGNQAAPPMLRVNRRHGSREALLASLAAAGVEAHAVPWLPDAVALSEHTDIRVLPGFTAGAFSVQDGAAQVAADLLGARDGMRVLDACVAPGGKAAHVLERADVALTALDSDARRLARVAENLTRLGRTATLVAADATGPATWWDGQPFDRILIDAPCSAIGVLRRHPDIRLHRRASDIAPLATTQGLLLAKLWPMLAARGRLVYATCSLLRAENERVIAAFLAAERDARAITPTLSQGVQAGAGWQLRPGLDGVDGMFYAVLDNHP